MKAFLKGIVNSKEELNKRIEKVLSNTGNLYVLNKANIMLSALAEMIIKVIYISGGMFLSDLKIMFSFSADNQKIERTIKDLKEQGYILVEKTNYGNLVALSKCGVEQIVNNPKYTEEGQEAAVTEMKIKKESYLKQKLISGKIAEYVFQYQIQELRTKFYATDKLKRNRYICKQYLKNITYRDYLKLEETDRVKQLIEIGIDVADAFVMGKIERYSGKVADKFSEAYFNTYGFEKIKAGKEYIQYIAYIRENCLKEENMNTFFLLKEFQGKMKEYYELEILFNWNCNIYKTGMVKVWKRLLADNPNNELIKNAEQLELCNQYIRWISDAKRSLISTNAFKKREDSETLKEILDKIKALEFILEKYREKKEELEVDFSFSVLSNIEEGETSYDTKIITFKRLEQNGIYVEPVDKKKIRFYILQQQDDFFEFFSLHKKTSVLYQFFKRMFPYHKIEIQVLVYNEEQKAHVNGKLSLLSKKLLIGRDTALLGNTLLDVMSVKVIRNDVKERYEFYKEMYNYLKTKEEALCS